ncbi:MAG: hypothetical protein JXQ87_13165 [Bacteroidia bacterium]
MKKATVFLIAILSGLASLAHGIDGCGSAQINAGLGQIGRLNYFGVNYGLVFNSFSSQNIWGQKITEKYNTHNVNLGGRLFLTNWMAIKFNTVYNYSIIDTEGDLLTQSGLGDSRFMFEFPIINNGEGNLKSYIALGAGVETPTGKSSNNIHLKSFSIGSGSWDFPINIQGIIRNDKKALAFSAEYQLNSFNQNYYKFGNQFTLAISGIKKIELPAIKMNFSLGMQFLNFGGDIYEDEYYYNAYSNEFTALMINAMTQLSFETTTFQLGYNLPAYLISESASDITIHWLSIGVFKTLNKG